MSHTLANELETLELTGSTAIDGAGNGLANRIVGNAASNSLDGGAGVDMLVGRQGDDFYTVDNGADRVVERDGEGT